MAGSVMVERGEQTSVPAAVPATPSMRALTRSRPNWAILPRWGRPALGHRPRRRWSLQLRSEKGGVHPASRAQWATRVDNARPRETDGISTHR